VAIQISVALSAMFIDPVVIMISLSKIMPGDYTSVGHDRLRPHRHLSQFKVYDRPCITAVAM
jgi:hypothetical protein